MDYILTLAIIQGIILLAVLLTKRNSDKRTVKLMAILLGLTVTIMFGRVSYQPEFLVKYWAFVSLPDVLLFVFGPLSYLLTLSILNQPTLPRRVIFYHSIPALFHALFLNIFIGLIIIDALPPFNWNHVGVIYTWLEGAGIFSIGMYLLLSVKTYEQYKRAYYNHYASSEPTAFLKRFLILGVVLVFLWKISFIGKLLGLYQTFDYTVYHLFWVCVSFSIYLFAYQILIAPQTFDLPESTSENERPVLDVEQTQDVLMAKSQLILFMKKEKPYLNPELNLAGLATMLNMKRNELSYLINAAYEMNFFDFTNSKRVDEFIIRYPIKKKEDPSTTLLEVAFEVGFNSKSAFNRAFKKHKGLAPSIYFKSNTTESESVIA